MYLQLNKVYNFEAIRIMVLLIKRKYGLIPNDFDEACQVLSLPLPAAAAATRSQTHQSSSTTSINNRRWITATNSVPLIAAVRAAAESTSSTSWPVTPMRQTSNQQQRHRTVVGLPTPPDSTKYTPLSSRGRGITARGTPTTTMNRGVKQGPSLHNLNLSDNHRRN